MLSLAVYERAKGSPGLVIAASARKQGKCAVATIGFVSMCRCKHVVYIYVCFPNHRTTGLGHRPLFPAWLACACIPYNRLHCFQIPGVADNIEGAGP